MFGSWTATQTRSAAATSAMPSADRDVPVHDPPHDSISSLAFCPTADYLAVASWDNQVRIYEVGRNGHAQGKAVYQHGGPVLDVAWSKDGKLFSAGADKTARVFDVSSGQSSQVAQHDDTIKCLSWVDAPTGGILVTGSWDKTLKYWDLRSPNPVSTVQLPERCYTLDVVYPLMVVGTAERHIQMFNLTNPTQPYKTTQSPLRLQTRIVSCFPSADGFAVGSVEGRVAMQYVNEKAVACHRKEQTKTQTLVYAVNDIKFHPVHGTFSTAGSDGAVHFWDKDARARLHSLEAQPGPITATCFNGKGTIFAYAVSNDWSKGHSGMATQPPNKILLHPCADQEVKPRLKK